MSESRSDPDMKTIRSFLVLIVEDDDATARALRVLIHRRCGALVLWASNIVEARDLIREHCPDVILLDLMMPGGDGEDLLEQLRQEDHTARIIVITACHEGSPRHARAKALKPDTIVVKPYDLDKLIGLIAGSGT